MSKKPAIPDVIPAFCRVCGLGAIAAFLPPACQWCGSCDWERREQRRTTDVVIVTPVLSRNESEG